MRTAVSAACVFLLSCTVLAAGTFEGLEPGVSTEAEIERVLGPPVREVVPGSRYDYDPTRYDARRISVEFAAGSDVIANIDLYLKQQYQKSDFRGWFDLTEPAKISFDDDGNLVEWYVPQAISLHYDGPSDNDPVKFFRHFGPVASARSEPVREADVEPGEASEVRTLFSDDFDGENQSRGVLNYRGFENWTVTRGEVDLIGNGFWDVYPENGLYLDLDGTSGGSRGAATAGTLETRQALELRPGIYRLRFDLANYEGVNTVTVSLGEFFEEDFNLTDANATDGFIHFSRTIEVDHRARARLVFAQHGGDWVGLLLDNVELAQVDLVPDMGRTSEPVRREPAFGSRSDPSTQDISPGSPGPDYFIMQADRAEEEEDWPALLAIVEEGLRLYPEAGGLWNSRASYYLHDGGGASLELRRSELLSSSIRAYELEPNGMHTTNLGWVYYKVFDDCDSARIYFEKVEREVLWEHPIVLFYMATCYQRSGDRQRAISHFREFLERAPDSPKAPEARDRLEWLGG